jgi:hypothetical protein
MRCFSLDYFVRQVVVSGKKMKEMSLLGRKVPPNDALGLSFEAGIRVHSVLSEASNSCDPSMRRNDASSRSTLRAAIRSWSPGASPFLGSSIRKKL